jgi:hypothetical protein
MIGFRLRNRQTLYGQELDAGGLEFTFIVRDSGELKTLRTPMRRSFPIPAKLRRTIPENS